MILVNVVEIKWNAKNKKLYMSLGYTFTKMRDSFFVKIEDLPKYSKVPILCKCDYCNNEYYTRLSTILNGRKFVKKDCCNNSACTGQKAADVLFAKYGVSNASLIESAVEKRKQTNINRYGVENVFSSESVKEKIKNSFIEKYGVSNCMQLQETIDKSRQTCLEKYGAENYSQTEEFKHFISGENSPVWKGGITQERYERVNVEYRKWRTAIFTRDNFTCQICGANKGVELNAHHIFNWKDNEDKRYDLNNGICLCQKCHIKFHSLYGKKNNTDVQLEEFIKLWKKDMLN